jgi:hypothetical protein
LRYVFESNAKIRFFFDKSNKIYDSRTNLVVKDEIKLLSINTQPSNAASFTEDIVWEISSDYKGLDGYKDTKKIEVTFADVNDDGIVDNPSLFKKIVYPATTDAYPLTRYIVLKKYTVEEGQEDYKYVDNSLDTVMILNSENEVTDIRQYKIGQYFYFVDVDVVKYKNEFSKLIVSLDYKVYPGRDNIKFQYVHSADYETRIDPGLSNIIDVYVLTKNYDIQFRQWLTGSRTYEPLPPSSDALYATLSPSLNQIKSISDEIIYHPVKYRVLFGSKANVDVQAVFKVVKNAGQVISDNEIKANVLIAINEFFALENWDFGDTFYFSELATYVMNNMAPMITNFVLVPRAGSLAFGGLYEIKAESDQLFISGATVEDIEIISSITTSNIKSSGDAQTSLTALIQQTITSSTDGV